MSRTARVRFAAADGALLNGRLRLPDGRLHGAAVICHPHPSFGGHMDVWLLPAVAERLAEAGWAALRFDFRSAGRPGGTPQDSGAALGDVAGAVDLVTCRAPHASRCALIGWSFGALVGLLAGLVDARVTDWVGIAPPTRPVAGVVLPSVPAGVAHWSARRTVIVGEHDQYCRPDRVSTLAPDAIEVLSGADHFLYDRDDEVASLVLGALNR